MSVIFPVVHRWFNSPFIGLLGLDRLYEVKKSSGETFRLFLYPLRYDNRLETLFQVLFIQSYSFIHFENDAEAEYMKAIFCGMCAAHLHER